ncbi:hypothetical protein ABBQ38_010252 [Trebouxia sp. C0009 RCD-2024]
MESVIRMCLDAMALQYLQNTGHPSHGTTTALSVVASNQPPPGYDLNPQELPRQWTHLSGQTPTPQQAPQTTPSLPPAHSAVQQQLQRMSMQSWGLPYQTAKQTSGDSSQPDESARRSSPSSIAESCVSMSHAPRTHSDSLESTPAASASPSCQDLLAAEPPAAQLPCLTHAHLVQLQSHGADFTDKDRRDWLVSLRFLRAAMQHAHWPGDIWSEDTLLDMVGRIASNNFGIYSTRQRSHPQQPVTPSKFCKPLAVPDQAPSCQSQCLLPPTSTLPNSVGHAASSQIQSSFDDSVQQQTLPRSSLSPHATATDASQQALLRQADAGVNADPRGLLPWPLQAEAQTPLPSSSQTPGAEDGTSQRSPPTVDKARDHQPFPPGPLVHIRDRTAPSKEELLSKKGSKVCDQRAPARQKPAKEAVVGREMYITASFFNHSCEPNCVKHRLLGQQSGIATVTALRDIKASQMHAAILLQDQAELVYEFTPGRGVAGLQAGEALTISYIDLELPRSARQLELKTCFFFDCKCVRCERELTEGSKKCSYAHNQTQRKNQAPKRRGIKARVSRC